MKEQMIEEKLRQAVIQRKGWCLKWTSQSLTGIPDRIVLLPGGKIAFVEVKAPGELPRRIQIKRMKQLQTLGFNCYVLDNPDDIEQILEEIANEV